ncbi:hypothetical protein C0Q70_13839 [Pomacea canaliculata]|uniref:Nuclear receptor domain-containing protein n=1 Tax=Pomacea canaliculata TaxID=400727 RepID=A0A2T7NYB6_POMCA|nr:hypothetical protein C0Q70_13839 [Pomacea canaliculata]
MSCDLQPPHAYHYDDTGNGDPTFGQTDLPPPADPSRPLVSGQAPDRLLPELTSFQPLGDVLSPPVTSPPSACQLSFPEDPALTMATHTGHLPFPEGTATTATSTCQPAVSPQDKDRDPRPSSRSRERRRLNYRTGDDGLTAGPCPPRVDTPCDVCGEPASGHYFGALVCLPCKSFFIRCTKTGDPVFSSQCGGTCDVHKLGRIRCQFCRFQRCLSAGMFRKEKPEAVVPAEGQMLCKVCCDIANGVHFGVTTCEGCKKFFRRGLKEHQAYVCKVAKKCTINPRMRNNCRYCRFQKCLNVGMSRDGKANTFVNKLIGSYVSCLQAHDDRSESFCETDGETSIKMGRPKKDGRAVCRQDTLQASLETKLMEPRTMADTFPPSYPDLNPLPPPPSGKYESDNSEASRQDVQEQDFSVETYESSSFSDDFLAAVSMDLQPSPGPATKHPSASCDDKTLMTSPSVRSVTSFFNDGSNVVGPDRLTSPGHMASDFFSQQRTLRRQLSDASVSSAVTECEYQRAGLSPELDGSLVGRVGAATQRAGGFLTRCSSLYSVVPLASPTSRQEASPGVEATSPVLPTTFSRTISDPGCSRTRDASLATAGAATCNGLFLPRQQLGSDWLPGVMCRYSIPRRYQSQQETPGHSDSFAPQGLTNVCQRGIVFDSEGYPLGDDPSMTSAERVKIIGSRLSEWRAETHNRDTWVSPLPRGLDLYHVYDTVVEQPAETSGALVTSAKMAASRGTYVSQLQSGQPPAEFFLPTTCDNPPVKPVNELSFTHGSVKGLDGPMVGVSSASRRRSDSALNCPTRVKSRRRIAIAQDHSNAAEINGQLDEAVDLESAVDDDVFLSKYQFRRGHCDVAGMSRLTDAARSDLRRAHGKINLEKKTGVSGMAWVPFLGHLDSVPYLSAESQVKDKHEVETYIASHPQQQQQQQSLCVYFAAPEQCCMRTACDRHSSSSKDLALEFGRHHEAPCSAWAPHGKAKLIQGDGRGCRSAEQTGPTDNRTTFTSPTSSSRLNCSNPVSDRRGHDNEGEENCQPRSMSAGRAVHVIPGLDNAPMSIAIDNRGLLDVNRHFLAIDNSCETNGCHDGNAQAASLDHQGEPPVWRTGRQVSSTSPRAVNRSSDDKGAAPSWQGRRHQSWETFSARREHEYWHQQPLCEALTLATDTQQTIHAVLQAVTRLREDLSDPRLHKMSDHMEIDKSVQTLEWMYRFKHVLTTASDRCLAALPGCEDLTSEDRALLSQAAGFGAVLILTAYLEYDADLKMFRQVWNWAVPLQSPLFTFKVNLLEVADLILQAGLDPTEMALLCALCLLRTDIEGIRSRNTVFTVKAAMMEALQAHLLDSLVQQPRAAYRVQLTAWYNNLVQLV